jgi:hypothetical protein
MLIANTNCFSKKHLSVGPLNEYAVFSVRYELVIYSICMNVSAQSVKQGLRDSTKLSEDRGEWLNVKKAVTRLWVP